MDAHPILISIKQPVTIKFYHTTVLVYYWGKFMNITHIPYSRKFLPVLPPACSHWRNIYLWILLSRNTKVPGFGEIFVQRKFSAMVWYLFYYFTGGGLPQGLVSCRRSRSERNWSGSTAHRRSSHPQRQTWCPVVSSCKNCRQSAPDAKPYPSHSQTGLWEQEQSEMENKERKGQKVNKKVQNDQNLYY